MRDLADEKGDFFARRDNVMQIGFIGAGKVGMALGLYFQAHGFPVAGYCSRTEASARKASELTGTVCYDSMGLLCAVCDVLFVTTPDGAISEIDAEAAGLLRAGKPAGDKVWLHVSGALPSSAFAQLSAAGCAVGSLHPLQSFGNPSVSADALEHTYFTVEGTSKAKETMCALLNACGARYSELETSQKPLYHAGACVLSNYLVTLLDTGFYFLHAAGMPEDEIFDAVSPLILGTLENVREKGTVDALTGPIARGDTGTVAVHMSAIESALPQYAPLYRSLGEATLDMIEGKKLGREKAAAFKTILRGCGINGHEIHDEIIPNGKGKTGKDYDAHGL